MKLDTHTETMRRQYRIMDKLTRAWAYTARHDNNWGEKARCRGMGLRRPASVDFYALSRDGQRAAVAICRQCPVQIQCLDHALATKQEWGVWGGKTEAERQLMTKGKS